MIGSITILILGVAVLFITAAAKYREKKAGGESDDDLDHIYE